MGPFEIEAKDITRLDQCQLTLLLRRLLELEAGAIGIPLSGVHVPVEINVADGGEDGRIKWEGGVDRTDFLPKRVTMFQVKARRMNPQACYAEVLQDDEKKRLKGQVAKVLDDSGAYIIFCKEAYVGLQVDKRVAKVREALSVGGRSDSKTAHIEFYDSNKISSWVNRYLAAQVYVLSCVGRNVPLGVKTWEDWSSHQDYECRYVMNERLKLHIETLKQYLTSNEKPVVRLMGLSGLGKTRLALELFRTEEREGSLALSRLRSNVIYFDAAGGADELVRFIGDTRNQGCCALLVVDNCEPELHRRLAREVGYAGKRVGVLTIDFSEEKVNGNARILHITQEDCKGVVKGILEHAYPELAHQIISRVEEFAQDFPSIAVLLAKQVRQGVEDIGRISDDRLVKRLLWVEGRKMRRSSR